MNLSDSLKKNPEKSTSWFPQKILSSMTVFNIDNKKLCFLSRKSLHFKIY